MRVNIPENFDASHLITYMKLKDVPQATRFPATLDEKAKVKNIKKIEAIVRGSLEYKEYIKFLKEYVNMNKCYFLKRVTNANKKKISIEIHHEPFTLFDITKIVLNKWMEMEKDINHFLIAEEVIGLHYKNMVGLIPLSKTPHEEVHLGKLFIPLQEVYGKGFVDFVQQYDNFIDDDLRKMLNEKIELSRDAMIRQDTTILEKKYIYIDDESVEIPDTEQL